MIFFFFLWFCRSWWNGPHEIIALVASRYITSNQKEYLNTILNTWDSEQGNISSVASWFDSMTYEGSKITVCKHWHFCDTPIADESVLKVQTEFHTEFNITTALDDILNSIFNETTTSYWALNFAFRALIHFVGDSHTPLHASDRYTLNAGTPKNDAGGNGFYITTDSSSIRNLHYLWDSAVYAYQNGPFTDDLVNDLMNEIGSPKKWFDSTELESLDPHVWVNESYNIAAKDVYDLSLISPNCYISKTCEYTQKSQIIAKKQILLAGYRLSEIFNKFFTIPRKAYKVDAASQMNLENESLRKQKLIGVIVWSINGVLVIVSIVYMVLLFHTPKSKKGLISKAGKLNPSLLSSLM